MIDRESWRMKKEEWGKPTLERKKRKKGEKGINKQKPGEKQ